ncbi:MAG: (Fe-S)-binding protein, partial [Ardenticatenaceae bacterium]|nr:(Fe-S)-binding protein [Ardenticatenaceae bacterium]
MPPSAHDFALRDMAFSNSDKFTLARHQPGATTSAYVFFPGCQLAGSAPGQVTAVYDYLQANLDGGVGLMLGCCGAPANWAGRKDLHDDALAQFQASYNELGRPKVVLACSSCFQTFQARLPGVELVSLYAVLEEKGLPETAVHSPTDAIAIHDPCTTRYETAVQDSVRHLVGQLGYDVEELPRSRETTTCCGFGGLMVYANRDLAKKVVAQRIAESPADYVTYCAVCRDYFAAQGKPTRHLLDLIFGSAHDGGHGPGFSQKHENRARLKRQILQERWGETVNGEEDYAGIKLNLSDEVLALMEDRLILAEDVQQVIAFAERTGQKLLSPATSHFLAQFRPNTVTYWVEYVPEDDGYTVFNAYSHRMDVGGKRP